MLLRIGIVGDFNPDFISHPSTDASLRHAASKLGISLESEWIPTVYVNDAGAAELLEQLDGIWLSAGSPYVSLEGALDAARFAREGEKPFFGT